MVSITASLTPASLFVGETGVSTAVVQLSRQTSSNYPVQWTNKLAGVREAVKLTTDTAGGGPLGGLVGELGPPERVGFI